MHKVHRTGKRYSAGAKLPIGRDTLSSVSNADAKLPMWREPPMSAFYCRSEAPMSAFLHRSQAPRFVF